MKTIIQGKNIRNTYKVVSQKDGSGNYVYKPYIAATTEHLGWSDIAIIDADVSQIPLELNEDDIISRIDRRFRVDLNAIVVHTDAITKEENINHAEAEAELAIALKEYTKQQIEADFRMTAYCKLHNLNPEDVDLDDLKKVLGEDKKEQLKNLWGLSGVTMHKDLLNTMTYTLSNTNGVTSTGA
jgi:hypothetical protein